MATKTMSKPRVRPISDHILLVLGKHKSKTYTVPELQQLLLDYNFKHTTKMIKDNLNILVKQGKLSYKDNNYSFRTE